MHKQATKPRKSVVKLENARRTVGRDKPSTLAMLRMGARKAGTMEDGSTMAEIFGRAIKGFEKRA